MRFSRHSLGYWPRDRCRRHWRCWAGWRRPGEQRGRSPRWRPVSRARGRRRARCPGPGESPGWNVDVRDSLQCRRISAAICVVFLQQIDTVKRRITTSNKLNHIYLSNLKSWIWRLLFIFNCKKFLFSRFFLLSLSCSLSSVKDP